MKYLKYLIVTLAVMLALPLVLIWLVSTSDNFLFSVGLLLIVNPVYALALGIYTGLEDDMQEMWSMPIVSAVCFLLASYIWTGFNFDWAFLGYAGFYLILSYISMCITEYFTRTRNTQHH